MSEPVGNSPRNSIPGTSAIPNNTHKNRDAEPEPRDKVEKIVEGKVIMRKPSWWKRLGHSIVADDAKSVGDYVLEDVIVPALKNLIRDIVVGGTDRTLFGTSKARARGPVSGLLSSSSLRSQYSRMPEEPIRRISQNARARHDFNEVTLPTRSEATDVIEALIARIAQYNVATVADLYDLCGVSGSYADRAYGWTDLTTADIQQTREGFLLDLPRPEPLR